MGHVPVKFLPGDFDHEELRPRLQRLEHRVRTVPLVRDEAHRTLRVEELRQVFLFQYARRAAVFPIQKGILDRKSPTYKGLTRDAKYAR